jgi:hypothetical protein
MYTLITRLTAEASPGTETEELMTSREGEARNKIEKKS